MYLLDTLYRYKNNTLLLALVQFLETLVETSFFSHMSMLMTQKKFPQLMTQKNVPAHLSSMMEINKNHKDLILVNRQDVEAF